MKKKMLWKDVIKCFSKSKARFISILFLVALGSFALVGLKVAGPDMRATGETYFSQLNATDITIIGDYGIDSENEAAINKVSGAIKIEYGYLKDVVIKGSNDSVRVFSETDGISDYEIVSGRMPEKDDEIAISSFLSDDYKLGDTIKFEEKSDISGDTVLKNHKMKIVGFVNSSELLSKINMGQSTAGTGALQAYAVTTKDAFDSDIYMIARISYSDTKEISPYSSKYTKLVQSHKDELDKLLADQPAERLAAIKSQYQTKINDARSQISDAKQQLADALETLKSGESKLASAKSQYQSSLSEYNSKKAQLNSAEATLNSARSTLDSKWAEYDANAKTLETQLETLQQTKSQLDTAQQTLDQKIEAAEAQTGMTIDQIEAALPQLEKMLPEEQYQQLVALVNAKNELESNWTKYNAAAQQAETAKSQLAQAKANLDSSEKQYATNKQTIDSGKSQLTSAKVKLDSAAAQISESETTLADGWAEYNSSKPEAESEIADAKEKVTKAENTLNNLSQPVYAIDTRREIPGSEGYRVYSTVAGIIDSLANIFPIFLYFVAALVTLTTMTRFVSEERINSGTLKH